ncbi:MAG: hypothetical protein NTY65_04900 [Planctomycetota bacterium]|nr:hypothetical protein [Planctomycetota bacterium]
MELESRPVAAVPRACFRYSGEGWRWPTADPLITVTLKDGRKVEIMMAVAGKPPFLVRGALKTFFDSPRLVALVNETIHAGLVADLADPDFVKKFKAAAALFDRGDAVGESVLVEALHADKPLTVRAGAAVRLLKKHPQEALKTAEDLAAAALSGSDGQALVRAVAASAPAQAVPLLRKFWLEGKFPLHDRCAIQGLGRIASPEAIETLIDVWGSGPDFEMQLVYAAGHYFKPEEKAEAAAWWQKNKSRPRMELLADGFVTDAGGHGYGQYPLEEMQNLDPASAVRELMRRLPAAGGDELERITKGLQNLTGVFLGADKNLWLQWWRSNPDTKPAAAPTAKQPATRGTEGQDNLQGLQWGKPAAGLACGLLPPQHPFFHPDQAVRLLAAIRNESQDDMKVPVSQQGTGDHKPAALPRDEGAGPGRALRAAPKRRAAT